MFSINLYDMLAVIQVVSILVNNMHILQTIMLTFNLTTDKYEDANSLIYRISVWGV